MGVSSDRDPTLSEYLAVLRAMREPEQHIQVVCVGNTGTTWRTLRLEPWGTTLPLPPKQDYDVVAHGALADHDHAVFTLGRGDWLTLEFGGDEVVLYVATRTVGLAVFENAQLAWRW